MSRLPSTQNVEIRPQAQTFIMIALTLAYPMFGAGFELGAYGELIYERKVTAWTVVTAVWLGFILVPREQTGIRNWQLLVLIVPCIWLIAAGYIRASDADSILRPLLFILGLVSYLLCLPFAIFLVVKVVNPKLLNLQGWKPKLRILAIVMLFIVAGYLFGGQNYLFLSCSDFEVAGNMLPSNCSR